MAFRKGSPSQNSDDVMLSGSCYITAPYNPPTWTSWQLFIQKAGSWWQSMRLYTEKKYNFCLCVYSNKNGYKYIYRTWDNALCTAPWCKYVFRYRNTQANGVFILHPPNCVFALQPCGYDLSSFLFNSNQADTALHTHTTHREKELLEDGINHVCSRHARRKPSLPPHLSLVFYSLRFCSKFPLAWASCRLPNASRTLRNANQCWSYLTHCPHQCRMHKSWTLRYLCSTGGTSYLVCMLKIWVFLLTPDIHRLNHVCRASVLKIKCVHLLWLHVLLLLCILWNMSAYAMYF